MTSSDSLAAPCVVWALGVCRPLDLGEVAGNCSRVRPWPLADSEEGSLESQQVTRRKVRLIPRAGAWMFITCPYAVGLPGRRLKPLPGPSALASVAGREDAHRFVPWSSLCVCVGTQAPVTQLAARDRPGSRRRSRSEP